MNTQLVQLDSVLARLDRMEERLKIMHELLIGVSRPSPISQSDFGGDDDDDDDFSQPIQDLIAQVTLSERVPRRNPCSL